jgi:hypothetical protein
VTSPNLHSSGVIRRGDLPRSENKCHFQTDGFFSQINASGLFSLEKMQSQDDGPQGHIYCTLPSR